MHDEFSAVRTEMREMGEELRDELREDMRVMHYDVSAKILEQGIQMRALHEEVMGRLAVL